MTDNISLTANTCKAFVCASLCFLTTATAHATNSHNQQQLFGTFRVYDWKPGSLYQINTRIKHITSINLQPGEHIISTAAGGTTNWIVEQTKSGQGHALREHIVIKPRRAGLHDIFFITTNRRTYHLEIRSGARNADYTAAVSWKYSDDWGKKPKKNPEKETPLSGLQTDRLNFNYHFVVQRQPPWMPLRVFDDGNKTYIEFPEQLKARQAPALFELSDDGQKHVINYRVFGSFYIVDRLVDTAQLQVGERDSETVGIERDW
ncbi:MAG: P-type conjugative transfer protein TrbG [Myxococcota bacterium]